MRAAGACVRSTTGPGQTPSSDFRRAIDLKPSYPTAHHWYAINHLVPLGRFDEATEELHRALELDPLALAIKTSLGMKCYFAGRYDDAVRELSKTIELDESFGMARFFLGATYTEQSRHAEALGELEAAIRLSGRSPEILAALGYLHGVSGDVDAARGILDELRRLAERALRLAGEDSPRCTSASANARRRSTGWRRPMPERAADLAWLGVRPVFASLRAEPRFIALLKQMGLVRFGTNLSCRRLYGDRLSRSPPGQRSRRRSTGRASIKRAQTGESSRAASQIFRAASSLPAYAGIRPSIACSTESKVSRTVTSLVIAEEEIAGSAW